MGLWDWIFDTLTGRDSGAGQPTKTAGATRRDQGSVATLERPTGKSAPGDADARAASAESASAGAADTPECWWAPAGVEQTEPVVPQLKEPPQEIRAIEEMLVSHFDGHDLTMPPMPRVAERVLQHLRSSKCGMNRIAEVLAEDQVTAANLLRMANSVLYRGVNKITSLQGAVTRLGGNAIRTLMMHESLRAAVFQRKGSDPRLMQLVWRGSLASACVMHDLQKLIGGDADEAFLIGLMHDIGNVIVLRLVLEQRLIPSEMIGIEAFEYLCHECHQEFGELVADAWKLPPKLKLLISDHHTHPAPDDPLRNDRLTLILADMINQMFGFGPPAQYDLMRTRAVHELGLVGNKNFTALLDGLPESVATSTALYD